MAASAGTLDYSRFDHIGSDDSGDEQERPARGPPPVPVLEDLEDYFRRLDERTATAAGAGPVSVDRCSDDELARLSVVPFVRGAALFPYVDCAVCLADFCDDEHVVRLPCAAGHCFHVRCAREMLARSTLCPLCRVDVRRLLAPPERPPTRRAFGFTRDGGVIKRYEPSPPLEIARPSYIPEADRARAGYVEIEYPSQGVARIWRVENRPARAE
ncbi:hypothetical protein KFE25_003317 [Diacronema lutheri]|uniref:RING-type domain-containing protein n=1 Tax=Diacronema lutheri TaxID=2081491 RepID=A0A8J5XPC4_DIALT|nr:hypothetical protein KFE25_003317 [Diacronema lutheri]